MRKVISLALHGLCLLVFSITADAQQYKKQETTTELGKSDHTIFINNANQYVVISDSENDGKFASVEAYDSDLKQLYVSKLEQLSNMSKVGDFYDAAGLFLFGYKDKQTWCARVDDKTGAVTQAPALIFSMKERKRNSYSYFKGTSPDSAYYYIGCNYIAEGEKGMTIDGVVMDRQMKVISKFSFTTPEEYDDIQYSTGLLSNDGKLTIVYRAEQKTEKDNYVPVNYTILQLDNKGKASSSILTGLPVGKFDQVVWNSKNGVLKFTGLLSRTKKSGFTCMITGTYDLLQKKITAIKETELTKLIPARSDSRYYEEISKKGLVNDLYAYQFPFGDGSRFMVYRTNSTYEYQSYYGERFTSKPSYSVTFLTRGNIYVVKLNADNEPQWMKVIAIDQEEPDLNLHIGACFAQDSKSGLHIFYYDIKRNDNTEPEKRVAKVGASDIKNNYLTAVSVSTEGNVKKSFLGEANETDFHLSPERSYSVRNNELVYIAIRHKGLSFSARKLFEKAQYHLGTITIKP